MSFIPRRPQIAAKLRAEIAGSGEGRQSPALTQQPNERLRERDLGLQLAAATGLLGILAPAFDLEALLQLGCGERGVGAELRFLGLDPDKVEQRATRTGAIVVQPAKDFPHGWREVTLLDPDGYVWTVGLPIPGMP